MERVQPITQSPGRTAGRGQVVPQRPTSLPSRPERRDILEPVSYSSALGEQDRLYRAAKALDGAGDLVKVAGERIVEADRNLRQAAAEGASPSALAALEKLHMTYGMGACFVVGEVMTNPYDRY
jgi:hypothetical protein